MGLDEYTERILINELVKRKEKREKGLCDYCGRDPESSSCRFPKRHKIVYDSPPD